jgi:protease I
MTYPSIKIDLINAGAEWHDKEVVVDRDITSRNPNDLDASIKKL